MFRWRSSVIGPIATVPERQVLKAKYLRCLRTAISRSSTYVHIIILEAWLWNCYEITSSRHFSKLRGHTNKYFFFLKGGKEEEDHSLSCMFKRVKNNFLKVTKITATYMLLLVIAIKLNCRLFAFISKRYCSTRWLWFLKNYSIYFLYYNINVENWIFYDGT